MKINNKTALHVHIYISLIIEAEKSFKSVLYFGSIFGKHSCEFQRRFHLVQHGTFTLQDEPNIKYRFLDVKWNSTPENSIFFKTFYHSWPIWRLIRDSNGMPKTEKRHFVSVHVKHSNSFTKPKYNLWNKNKLMNK